MNKRTITRLIGASLVMWGSAASAQVWTDSLATAVDDANIDPGQRSARSLSNGLATVRGLDIDNLDFESSYELCEWVDYGTYKQSTYQPYDLFGENKIYTGNCGVVDGFSETIAFTKSYEWCPVDTSEGVQFTYIVSSKDYYVKTDGTKYYPSSSCDGTNESYATASYFGASVVSKNIMRITYNSPVLGSFTMDVPSTYAGITSGTYLNKIQHRPIGIPQIVIYTDSTVTCREYGGRASTRTERSYYAYGVKFNTNVRFGRNC